MITVRYTPRFVKKFKKLPPRIQQQAVKKETLFKKNPQHPTLKTHALTGKLKSFYAFSVSHHCRIMFAFEPNDSATFIDVGTHSIYH